ncbi:LysR family transcriptional regulator [Nocardioides sp.]|uniref:LysR family transcriptional regulator n=1 Tax=Nocardioides sp. TaxID=35761 RepID=UPI00261F05C5|nr:LysR family transcriptional regulator [Nocardioides sp.]
MSLAGTDLNLLVALQALLEEGNVTRAGERIGMSQPAMSAALRKLRRRFGDELLIKVGRDLELTPLARTLLPQVQHTMPMIEQAFGLGKRFRPTQSRRRFVIGASDYAMVVLGPELRRRLRDEAPGVAVEWRPLPPDLIARPQGLQDADAFIAPRGLGLEAESVDLFEDHFVLVLDPGHRALRHGRLEVDQLARVTWARAELGVDHLNPADRQLSELGLEHGAGVTTRGWLPLPFLVRGTELVAIMPGRLARATAGLAGLATVAPPFGTVRLREALWWHARRDHDPGHRWLRALLVQIGAEVGVPIESEHGSHADE